MYVLNLDDNNRILSIWKVILGADYGDRPIVETMPDGDVTEYRYVDGEYVHDPLPIPEEPEHKPTQEERITALEAQLAAYEAAYAEGVNEA